MVYISDRETYKNELLNYWERFKDSIEIIKKAFDLAIASHEWQIRKYEWVPFVTHPIAISLDLATKYWDVDLLIAWLIHDTVEDCDDVQMNDIYDLFGSSIWHLVDAVTDSTMCFYGKEDVIYADKIEKILAWGMTDVRVLLLKIADRDHNLKTLEWLKPTKQVRMAFETQAIYVPLKEMLWDRTNITELWSELKQYLSYRSLNSPEEIKNHLYSHVYKNFDTELYNLVYGDTGSIIREINDEDWYIKLLEDAEFEESCSFVSFSSDGDCFSVKFQFTSGSLMRWSNWSWMKVSEYSTILS